MLSYNITHNGSGICVVRPIANFKIKYNTHLAYNIYTMLCTVKLKIMIFGLYPVTVVILIITTSLNAALATDKRNNKRWINVICTIVGLVGIIYSSVYGA